jgi:DNA-binding transcriptional ArsR family regulator
MKDGLENLGSIFFVLSDPMRRRVLGAAIANNGATVTELCELFPVSRFAVMRHLNVLEDAGFIRREANGRERRVYSTDYMFEEAIVQWAKEMRERRHTDVTE